MVALEETEKDTGLRKYMLLLPQAWASVLITSFHLMVGEIMAYSAVVVPQLMDDQSLITNSTVHITGSDIAWIVSAPVLTASLTCVVAGVLVDYIGRLKIIIFSAIPAAISSILIASATNVSMIVWGRIISGICLTFISTSTTVYVSEISRPDVRGSFLSLLQPFVSTGLILVYLKGWLMNWRMIALLINAYALIPIVVVLFIPESPAWLVSKGRIAQARKSLRFFYRYHSEKSDLVEEELKNIIEEQMQKRERFELKKHLQLFLLPTFYKPFLILCATFFFQQFSGIFAIITYCIIFFKQIGSSIDPYLASICTAGVKLVMSVMVTVLMKKFNRRPLYIFGASGMAVSIALSGLNTQWIQRGTSNQTWLPLVFLLLYVLFSSMGITSMPFMISGEMFPIKIRGISCGVLITIVNIMTFMVLQLYLPLQHFFGDSANLQYFFSIMSLGMALTVYVFLPETHKYKLVEIEEHFKQNTIYRPINSSPAPKKRIFLNM